MLGINRQWTRWRALVSFLTAVVLVLSLVSCGDRAPISETSGPSGATKTAPKVAVSEVSPPEGLQQLRSFLEVYQPQVSISTPQPGEVFQDTTVEARFQVKDLPVFKDPKLGLGPHLQVILDNQPYQAVYDLNQPLVFKDLPPGTHTLRVFASRPWHESFKNEGAYAQTTFHIFTKTADNSPDPAQPLLTYNSPTGSYGAEPIMLDFYLTNAPLHLVAQEKPNDEIADWRIRVTVNGQSFALDKWQPIYLKGFTPGKNWVKLEFIDEKGNQVNNVFNNTVRLITYEPNGKDTLSKLVRGELSADDARSIVELNYTPKPTPVPSPVETPKPSESVPVPSEETPRVEKTPATPEVEPTQTPVTAPAETPPPSTLPTPSPTGETTPSPEPTPAETKQIEKPLPGGFFNRFRRPATSEPTPAPTLPEVIPTPVPDQPAPPEVTVPPLEATPSPLPTSSPQVEIAPLPEPTPDEPQQKQKSKLSDFFNRFRRRPAPKDVTPAPTPPEVIHNPTPEVTAPLPEATPSPTPSPKVEPPPVSETAPTVPNPEEGNPGSLSGPSPSQSASPSLPLTLPEVINSPTPPPLPEVKVPSIKEIPASSPSVTPDRQVKTTPSAESAAVKPTQPESLNSGKLVNPLPPATPSPVLPPTLPEIFVTPSPEPVTPQEKEILLPQLSDKPDKPPTPEKSNVKDQPET